MVGKAFTEVWSEIIIMITSYILYMYCVIKANYCSVIISCVVRKWGWGVPKWSSGLNPWRGHDDPRMVGWNPYGDVGQREHRLLMLICSFSRRVDGAVITLHINFVVIAGYVNQHTQ